VRPTTLAAFAHQITLSTLPATPVSVAWLSTALPALKMTCAKVATMDWYLLKTDLYVSPVMLTTARLALKMITVLLASLIMRP
jgi:hypothetical protein